MIPFGAQARVFLDEVRPSGVALPHVVRNLLDHLCRWTRAHLRLSDFFSLNDAAIRTTGADPKALAVEALETEAKLGALVRERRLRDASATLDTDARDRAIAHLVAAMREVRDGGAFAFRKDPRKAKFFRAMLPKRATRKKPEAPVTPAQPE